MSVLWFRNDELNNLTASQVYVRICDNQSKGFKFSIGEENSILVTIELIKKAISKLSNVKFELCFEYRLIGSQKRIDLIIIGRNYVGQNLIYLIEVKQWTSITNSNIDGIVNAFINHSVKEVLHPSLQVHLYQNLLFNNNVKFEAKSVSKYVLLTNYNDELVKSLTEKVHARSNELATIINLEMLVDLLNQLVDFAFEKVKNEFENLNIKPSKVLKQIIRNLFNKTESSQFLIDEQTLVYKTITQNQIDSKKQVYIITGGPGTGKTILALNLIANFISKGFSANYVTKNATPRVIYKTLLTKEDEISKAELETIFSGPAKFLEIPESSLDYVIVDEAHRLVARSGLYSNKGENQIREIIKGSKVSIFFIDEDQIVTSKDIGTINSISSIANEFDTEAKVLSLDTNFRNNGSAEFIKKVRALLYQESNTEGIVVSNYDVKVFDDPNILFSELVAHEKEGSSARLVSGYCWDWNKENSNNPNYYDIDIPEFGFKKSINLAINTRDWAIANQTIEQVGGYHAIQGIELDYVGVIIGDDLRFENNKLITDPSKRAKTDQSLRGLKNDPDYEKLARKIILNTYYVLLTRGIKGCYIFSTNKELNSYIKKIFIV